MSFFDQDFSNVPSDQAEVILPPTIQWWRGDRQSDNEVLSKGGFELPVERYSLEEGEPVNFQHGNVDQPGYGFKGLHLAVVAHHKAWYDRDSNQRVYGYSEGRRVYSKLRLWALVKQLDNREFLLSFSGMDSKAVEDALSIFKKSVIKVASDKAGVQFPLYTFWFPLLAGPVVEWKQGGYSTPPQLGLKPPLKDETFKKIYVGTEVIEKAKKTWTIAQEWVERMSSRQAEVETGAEPSQPTQPQQAPPPAFVDEPQDAQAPVVDEIPF